MADVNVELKLQNQLEMCFKIVEQYSWLLNSYILDYFIENHAEKLPKSWRLYCDSTTLNEFSQILCLSSNKLHILCPLSIICLKSLILLLSLPRYTNNYNISYSLQSEKEKEFQLKNETRRNLKELLLLKEPKLVNLFLKHVKPKKQYEILKIASIINNVAKKLGVKYVVDFGSGLGHLSRIIAYGFNLKVCAVETQFQLTLEAEKLDSEFEIKANKYLNHLEYTNLKSRRPIHLNQTVKFNLNAAEFVQDLKAAFSFTDKDFKFGIVGLHPCGDLAAVLIKLYTECSEAKFINLVGCCYHKLTTTLDYKNDVGFPLTEFCANKNVNISYEARALACHAIESYSNKLKSKKHDHLKIHCYRAALERIIIKNWPHYKKCALGNVKAGSKLNFNLYCELALSKLGIQVEKDDLLSNETTEDLSKWQDIVKYYSLRLLLAPLIESIILLDRKLFLIKKGISCEIVAAFDPEISPRNHLLMSEKPL